ncbi:MAG: hypothetical protein WCY86_02930 [Spirosomataceae bacterium]
MNWKTKSNAGNGKILGNNRNTTISYPLLHPTPPSDDQKVLFLYSLQMGSE